MPLELLYVYLCNGRALYRALCPYAAFASHSTAQHKTAADLDKPFRFFVRLRAHRIGRCCWVGILANAVLMIVTMALRLACPDEPTASVIVERQLNNGPVPVGAWGKAQLHASDQLAFTPEAPECVYELLSCGSDELRTLRIGVPVLSSIGDTILLQHPGGVLEFVVERCEESAVVAAGSSAVSSALDAPCSAEPDTLHKQQHVEAACNNGVSANVAAAAGAKQGNAAKRSYDGTAPRLEAKRHAATAPDEADAEPAAERDQVCDIHLALPKCLAVPAASREVKPIKDPLQHTCTYAPHAYHVPYAVL